MIKTRKLIFINKTVVNIYILFVINLWPFKQGADFTIGKFLFGAATPTKNTDFDKKNILDMTLDLMDIDHSFSLSNGSGFVKNVIICDTDMSSSAHVDNREKDGRVLG